jgi:membrane-associated phospholipid phosphatase
MGITAFQNALLDMVPNEASRAAFPSLHTGVSLLVLCYAWKYVRWYVLPLGLVVVGLLISTVYLRHHYVVDLLAGALLVPWTLWAAPRLDRAWARQRAAASAQ